MRRLVLTSLVLLAALAWATVHAETVVRRGVRLDRHGLIPAPLLRQALASLRRHRGGGANRRRIGGADLARPSGQPRFFFVNLRDGSVIQMRTTHGKGSDPDAVGRAVQVSNAIGSAASSIGGYVTAESYDSPAHGGLAVRLDGLDPTDSNARCRCVVVHAANTARGENYASEDWVRRYGVAGRSDGCLAFANEDFPAVLRRLTPGTFLFVGPNSLPVSTATDQGGCACPDSPAAAAPG